MSVGGSMEFLWRGQNSHLTLQINYTHLKKGHTIANVHVRYNTKFELFERANAKRPHGHVEAAIFTGIRASAKASATNPCNRKALNDPSATLQAAPEPPNHCGGLEQRRSTQRATNPSTLQPARRARTKAPVSQRVGPSVSR